MKKRLSLSALLLPLAVFATDGIYTGSGGKTDAPIQWTAHGDYSRILNAPWKDGYVARGGGQLALAISGTLYLQPEANLSLGSIDLQSRASATLTGQGFALSGAEPFLQSLDDITFTLTDSADVSGTGRLTIKTSPISLKFGLGNATFAFGNVFSGFTLLDLASGYVTATYAGEGKTCLTVGSVRLSGAQFTYKATGSETNSASMATGDGASLTFAPGFSSLSVLNASGASAALTVGPIVREGRAVTQIGGNDSKLGTLGNSEILKTTGSTGGFLHNGFVDPWLITYGDNDHASNGDFAAYDEEKGFVTATALYTNSLVTTAEKPIASLADNVAVSESVSVKGLRIVNTNTSGFGTITFANDATLKIGDGVNPAAMILNFSNKSGNSSGYKINGDGAIDFGSSEAIVWLCARDSDARRYFYVDVPIKGENGLTIASPVQVSGRGPIVQFNKVPEVKGDLHLRGVRFNYSRVEQLPFANVHVDGSSITRSAQLSLNAATVTNHIYASGNGFANSSDLPGALYGNGGAFTGPVTLTGDMTSLGGLTYNNTIDGKGTFTAQANNTANNCATFAAVNTYAGETVVKSLYYSSVNYPMTLKLTGKGTFGTGAVRVLEKTTVQFSCITNSFANAIEGEGDLTVSDNAVVTLTASSAVATASVDYGSLLKVRHLTAVPTGSGTIAAADGDSTVVIDSNDDVTTSVTFSDGSGKLRLVKRGKGKLRLLAAQNFTGGLVIEGGSVAPIRKISEPTADGRIFWLDATKSETMTVDANGGVTEWRDAGGSGFKFGTYSGYAAPTLVASGINGKASLSFDNKIGNRLIASADATYRTLFFVVQAKAFVDCGGLFGRAGKDRCGIRETNFEGIKAGAWSRNYSYAHFNTLRDGYTINGVARQAAIDYVSPQILVAERSDSDTINGERWVTFTAGLGGYTSMRERCFTGDIAEVIAYDRVMSDDERHLIENYLAQKWENKTFYTMSSAISPSCAVSLNGDGSLDLTDASLSVARVSGQGTIISDSVSTLAVADANDFLGNVSGPVSLVLSGEQASAKVTLSEGAQISVANGDMTLSPYSYQVPTDGLICWMDSSDPSTIATNATGEVTSWASKVGNAKFAYDGILLKPTYLPANASGSLDGNKPGVYFSGEGRMRLASDVSLAPATTFIVWHATAAGVAKGTTGGFWGYKNVDCGLRYWGNLLQFCNGASPFSTIDACYGNGSALAIGSYERTVSESIFPGDATHLFSAVAAQGRNIESRQWVMGSYRGSENRCFIGWMCEVMLFDRRLSDAERVAVENYLMTKWRRADALPEAPTAIGGSVNVAAGAKAKVPSGTAVCGGGTITGDVTLASPYVVAVSDAGAVPCLSIDGTATIENGTELQLKNAANIGKVFQPFVSATSLLGEFGSFSSDRKNCGYYLRDNGGYAGKLTGTHVIIR